jgi:hypothetical protein
MANSDVPLLLGRVCSGWRRIAYGCAELWASIHIAIPDPRTSDEEALLHRLRLEATTEWLMRSGVMPLHISIYGRFNRAAGRITNVEQCDWVTLYVKALLPFASRWKTLDIAVPLCLLEPWNNLTGQEVPLLRNIRILSTERRWGFISTRLPNSFRLLSQASLNSLNTPYYLNEFNKGSLTHLTVTRPQSFASTEEMVSFFLGFPILKKLDFSFGYFPSILPPLSAQTLALPYLEDLSLQEDGEVILVVAFWEAFHLPKLQRMKLLFLPSPLPRNIAAFGTLMNGSSRCFSLDFSVKPDWTETTRGAVTPEPPTLRSTEELSSYLRQCPSVTNLSVTCSDTYELGGDRSSLDVEEALLRAIFLDGDGLCLPRLETLNISLSVQALVENTALLHQALSSREQRTHDHPEICVPLKSLTVNGRCPLPRDFDINTFMIIGLQNYGTSFAAHLPRNINSATRTSAFDKAVPGSSFH